MRLKGRKTLKTTYGIAKFAVFTQYNFRAYGHFKKKKLQSISFEVFNLRA
jgi:hypothetical protein